MNKDLLQAVGQALYGTQWQTDIAAALGVNPRTVRRWVAGDYPIPAGIWEELRIMLEARATVSNNLIKRLNRGMV